MSYPRVVAVACDKAHNIVKPVQEKITLITDLGVEGDAHFGKTVQHRHDKKKNPEAPNLRQVHLIQSELFDEVAELGMMVKPGQMGENITTRGIDVLRLSRGTQLHIGEAIIEVTGLRNPCKYLNQIVPDLMKACIGKWEDGTVLPKTGIMGIVINGGDIRPGDAINITVPDAPYERLNPV